jgi:hypothetical protein
MAAAIDSGYDDDKLYNLSIGKRFDDLVCTVMQLIAILRMTGCS